MKALWLPKISYIKKTNIFNFQRFIKKELKISFSNYDRLWKWSIHSKEVFWLKLADYFKLNIYKQKNFKAFKKNKDFIYSSFFQN